MDINELRKDKAALVDEARQLCNQAEAENRDLNEEEQTKYDALMTAIEALSGRIDREERLQREELATATKVEQQEREEKHGEFRSFAEFLQAVAFNQADPRLTPNPTEKRDDPVATVGTPAGGGYLVPDQFLPEILQVKPEDAIVRPRARVIPAGYPPDGTIYIPALDQDTYGMQGGMSVSWIEEAETKPASAPKFARISLTPHEVAGSMYVTDKLLRNSAAFEPLARGLMRDAVIATEEAAFLSGAGTTQPTGLIGHASNVLINRAGASAISYADVRNMYARMLMGGSYVWIANQSTLPQLMALKDEANQLIWQPNAREGAPGTLLGIPCTITGKTPVLGTRGDLILADLKYYLIKDGSGIFVDMSSHFRFKENITTFKITWNVDGRPWPDGPFTLEDGSTTVSPFVVLDVPAGS